MSNKLKIAVLSGKGGTGKTFVSVNLAAVSGAATYIDCDVEEPNGRLFLKPQNVKTEEVTTLLPSFDESKCTACRKCVEFCRFNALVYIKDKPKVFTDVCHSCGGCVLVCPSDAVAEEKRQVGVVEQGTRGNVRVVTGIMNLGEASGVPVIKAALDKACSSELTLIDCPPGSACTVMECVQESDYCILVAEPTAFGLHNFMMVHELVRLLKKPCGVIINKDEGTFPQIYEYCATNHIPVLCSIPYSQKLALIGARSQLACEEDADTGSIFRAVLEAVYTEVARRRSC